MSGKIIPAVAAAILLALTGLASAAGAGGPSAATTAGRVGGLTYTTGAGFAQRGGGLYSFVPGAYAYVPGIYRAGHHLPR